MSLNPLLRGLEPQHPGEILAELILPALKAESGISKVAFADHLGMSRQALDNLLNGKSAITPETALRLGKLIGPNAEYWMDLQRNYDLKVASGRLGAEIEALPKLSAA